VLVVAKTLPERLSVYGDVINDAELAWYFQWDIV